MLIKDDEKRLMMTASSPPEIYRSIYSYSFGTAQIIINGSLAELLRY